MPATLSTGAGRERDLAYYQSDEGVWATIEGQVIGFPDVQDRGTHYQLAVERITVDGQSGPGAGAGHGRGVPLSDLRLRRYRCA